MIDSTKSPTPVWQRYAIAALVSVLVLVVAWMVWTKDLHKSSNATPPAPAAPSATVKAPTNTPPVATTVPGGIPVSNRNPFSS